MPTERHKSMRHDVILIASEWRGADGGFL